MTYYFRKEDLLWEDAPVRGGTVMQKSIVWEGDHDIRSAFFRMPKDMFIPEHDHPRWVQVMVLKGEMEIKTEQDGVIRISEGGCYFVEPGDVHSELALRNTLLLVTQAEDREAFRLID